VWFDTVIVGAGSAGCVLANRLTEDPTRRVLLLEAGGEADTDPISIPGAAPTLRDSNIDWAFKTVPQRHLLGRRIDYPRGRGLGGSSVLNWLVYIRGNKGDYDHWRQLGNVGWSYDDVLPYFIRAEANEAIRDAYHGTNGPLSVEDQPRRHPLCARYLEAAQSVGIPFNPDFNGARQEGCGYYQMTARGGRRCSTAAGYLAPARSRPNLTIVSEAMVLRLLIEGRRATGVEYLAGGRIEAADAGSDVILAAGAIGSPQILMLSGVGPADHLRARGIDVVLNLPGVGQDLQDHAGNHGVSVGIRDPDAFGPGPGSFEAELAQFERDGGGNLSSNHIEAGAFIRARPSDEYPTLQLFFDPGTAEYNREYDAIDHSRLRLYAYVCRPRSRGSVTLASANPLDRPLIDPNYFSDPDDLELAIEAVRRNAEIIRAKPFDDIRLDDIKPESSERSEIESFIRKNASTSWHPACTCRMGTDPRAVVDAELRVHGIANLRICDASVMPSIVSGTINAPVVMIAEKGADLIANKPPLILHSN
jgi:choline dehydrogenase